MALEAGSAYPILQAGGTLVRPRWIANPDTRRRLRLLLELGTIFILAPVLIRFAIFNWRIPLPLVLQPSLFGVIAFLLWDPTFRMGSEIRCLFSWRTLMSILLVFAAVAAGMSLYVWTELPGRFMELPLTAPRLWLFIVLFYPLVSVIPQELIYRTFFFHRYGPLFGDARWLAYLVNGLLFGFAHIIFGSYVSIGLTTVLGCLLAWRYDETRSFWAVWLEHTLYGCLVFTIGLGHYFFTGIATL
jgi:uncharacterized protein